MTTFADQLFFGHGQDNTTKKGGAGKGKFLEALGNLETAARDARLTERGPLHRNTYLRSIITSSPLRGKERGYLRRRARQEVGEETWAGMVALGVNITLDGITTSDVPEMTLPPPSELAQWDLEAYRVTSAPCAPCRERGWRCEWICRRRQQVHGGEGGCRGCVVTGREGECDRPWLRKEGKVDGQPEMMMEDDEPTLEQDDDEPEERNQEEMDVDVRTPHVEPDTELEMDSEGATAVNSRDDVALNQSPDVQADADMDIEMDLQQEDEADAEPKRIPDSELVQAFKSLYISYIPSSLSPQPRNPSMIEVGDVKFPALAKEQVHGLVLLVQKMPKEDVDVITAWLHARQEADVSPSPSPSPPPSLSPPRRGRKRRKTEVESLTPSPESEIHGPALIAAHALHAYHVLVIALTSKKGMNGKLRWDSTHPVEQWDLHVADATPCDGCSALNIACQAMRADHLLARCRRCDFMGLRCEREGEEAEGQEDDGEEEDEDDIAQRFRAVYDNPPEHSDTKLEEVESEAMDEWLDSLRKCLGDLGLGHGAQSKFEIPLELWTRIVLRTPPSKLPPEVLPVGEWILDFDIDATEAPTPCTSCTTTNTTCERVNATLPKGRATVFCRKCFFEGNAACVRGGKPSNRLKRWPTVARTVDEPASPTRKRKSVALGGDTPLKKKLRQSIADDEDDSDELPQRSPVVSKRRTYTQAQLAHRERFLAVYRTPPPTNMDLANLESPRMDEWLASLRSVLEEVGHTAQVSLCRDTQIPLPLWARIVLLTPPPVPVGEWVFDFEMTPTLAKTACEGCVERGMACERVAAGTVTAFCRGCFMAGERVCKRKGKPCKRMKGWPPVGGVATNEAEDDDESQDEDEEVDIETDAEPRTSLVDQFLGIYEEPPRFEKDLANAEGDDMDEWVDKLREVLRDMPTSQQHLLDVPSPLWTRIVLRRTPNSLPLAPGGWVDDFDVFPKEKKWKCLECGDDERCESIWDDEIKFCRKCFFAGSDKCYAGVGRACHLPANLKGLVEAGKNKATRRTRHSIVVEEGDDSPKKQKREPMRKSEHVEEEDVEMEDVDDDVKQQFLEVYENPPPVDAEMDEWLSQLRDVISELDLAGLRALQQDVDVPLPIWTRIILRQVPDNVDVGEWIYDFDVVATPCAVQCQGCAARGADAVCERVTVAKINRGARESQFCRACFFEGEEFCARGNPANRAQRLKRWPQTSTSEPNKKTKRHSIGATEKFAAVFASGAAADRANEESLVVDAWLADMRALLGGMSPRAQMECRRQAEVPLDVWARIVLGRTPSSLPLPVGPWILDFDVHATLRDRACMWCEKKGVPCERISVRKVATTTEGGKEVLSIFCRGCFFKGRTRCGISDERSAKLLDKWVGLVEKQDEDDADEEEREGGDVEQEMPVMGEFSIDHTEHGVLSGRSIPPRSLAPSTSMTARTLDTPQARLIDRLERDVEKQTQELEMKEEELRVAREGLEAKEVALRALEIQLEEAERRRREEREREEIEREKELLALREENERMARRLEEVGRSEAELRAVVDVVRRTVGT